MKCICRQQHHPHQEAPSALLAFVKVQALCPVFLGKVNYPKKKIHAISPQHQQALGQYSKNIQSEGDQSVTHKASQDRNRHFCHWIKSVLSNNIIITKNCSTPQASIQLKNDIHTASQRWQHALIQEHQQVRVPQPTTTIVASRHTSALEERYYSNLNTSSLPWHWWGWIIS